MESDVQSQIVQFNRIFKRYDELYRKAARNFDMPELALWIVYAVRENPVCTQKDIVDLLLQPKQSIHSALKTLEKEGYVALEFAQNNRRNKYIHLTEKGIALAENTADKIVCAEKLAFLSLTDAERETVLRLFERLTSSLRKEMQKIKELEKSENEQKLFS